MRILLVVFVFAFAGLLAVDLQSSSAPRAAVATRARADPEAGSDDGRGRLRQDRLDRPRRAGRAEGDDAAGDRAARAHAGADEGRAPAGNSYRAIRHGQAPLAAPARGTTWFASFSRSTFGAGSAETKRTRLWQIAATLAPLGEQEFVAVASEGRFLTTARLGVRPGTWRAETGEKDYAYVVRGLQLRLSALGYLDSSDATGSTNYLTEQALLAFQGWEDLDRTGTVTGQTQVALFTASRPKPAARRPGKRIEISRDRGVLLMVEDGEVVRAVHTSTGSFGRTPTGDFQVYVKSLYSWSVPFHVWMPYAAYFRGGIATHQSPDVPSYPASHGCVRLPEGEAERVYRFVDVGTPVAVR